MISQRTRDRQPAKGKWLSTFTPHRTNKAGYKLTFSAAGIDNGSSGSCSTEDRKFKRVKSDILFCLLFKNGNRSTKGSFKLSPGFVAISKASMSMLPLCIVPSAESSNGIFAPSRTSTVLGYRVLPIWSSVICVTLPRVHNAAMTRMHAEITQNKVLWWTHVNMMLWLNSVGLS